MPDTFSRISRLSRPGTTNSIGDLRELARRRLPRALFDYIERGSYDELTFARNRADFDALALRQRVMCDVSRLSLDTTILGQPARMPLGIAPTGLTGLFWPDGEIHAARAAHAAGVPYTLSTMSICSIEEVRAACDGTLWFQLYFMRDRSFTEALMRRAHAARCTTLVLTLDLPLQALRRRDPKNGLAVPPRLTWRSCTDFATHPRWLLGTLRSRRRTFGNLATFFPDRGTAELSAWMGSQLEQTLAWKDIAWLRDRWPGKLVVKGILDAADARAAADAGVDGIVVSNHGGRQLDGASSTIAALPRVVDAVAGRCEVLLDGGITCGQSVLKALALGARACFVGRAYLYGLSALGGAGVTLALEILRRELEITLALCGRTNVGDVDQKVLVAQGDNR